MVDPAFDDFLNSDDDEFFLEASNHLLDRDFNLEYTSTKKENVSQNLSEASTSNYFKSTEVPSPIKQDISNINTKSSKISENFMGSSSTRKENVSQNLSEISTSKYFKPLLVPSPDEQDVSVINTKLSNTYKNVDKNSDTVVSSISSDHNHSKSFNEFKDEVTFHDVSIGPNKTEISNSSVNIFGNGTKDAAFATTSTDSNIFSRNSFTVATPTNSSYINSRFTPGFTPKAKKRKCGPAGFLEFFDGAKEASSNNPDKVLSMDMEFQGIVSSQYTPEHLSLPSWQKLQTTVSSCSNLHSTAKYYSIQRVLSESSKKKLPKHMVVPVLCVLLKKLDTKGSAVISIFMDDTGEINGKIDTEVRTKYKEFLVEGTALILKKVTFLCNVLILKDENLVSLYHPQGAEKHPQSLESVLETSEPLKPMNCECLKLSHVKKDALKIPHYNTPNHHTSKCVTHSQNRLNSISYQSKGTKLISQTNNTPKSFASIQSRTNLSNFASKSVPSLISEPSRNKTSGDSQSIRSNEFLERLLDEDNCMDEFDELLGNLDEQSFMEDV